MAMTPTLKMEMKTKMMEEKRRWVEGPNDLLFWIVDSSRMVRVTMKMTVIPTMEMTPRKKMQRTETMKVDGWA